MHQPRGWRSGRHLFECKRCGEYYSSDRKRKEWTGLIVCDECWEPRHSLDFVRGVRDDQQVENPQGPGPLNFAAATCSPTGYYGVAGIGTSGCARSGFDAPEHLKGNV